MTENEAVEILKGMRNAKVDYADLVGAEPFARGHKYVYPEPEDYAIEEAITALKEIRQYREIGTVEELKQLKEILPYLKSCRQSLDDVVRKCNEYEKIGTVEECREAVEKQKPKAVTNGKLIKNFYGRPYCIKGDCPTCGRESIKSTDTDYCYVCGQHLKYDENLEGMEDEH